MPHDAAFSAGETLRIHDTDIHVVQAGNPRGPALVLLHGGLGSMQDFGPLAALLNERYRLVAIDTRGHGRSSLGKAPLSYRQIELDVAVILEKMDLGTAGVLGHSDGGIVALRLAAFGTANPRFVVTVGAQCEPPRTKPERDRYEQLTAAAWRERFSDGVRAYEAVNPEPDFDRLFAAVRAMWLGIGTDAYPGSAVSRIRQPVLVVSGDQDVVTPRRHALDIVDQVPGALLLNLPFGTHSVLQESPESVMPSLERFIAEASISPGRPGTGT